MCERVQSMPLVIALLVFSIKFLFWYDLEYPPILIFRNPDLIPLRIMAHLDIYSNWLLFRTYEAKTQKKWNIVVNNPCATNCIINSEAAVYACLKSFCFLDFR